MRLPSPRGEISAALIRALHLPPAGAALPPGTWSAGSEALDDDDLQLTLFICYQLHYGGFREVDDRWEWEPSLLALRATAEARFEDELHAIADSPRAASTATLPQQLFEVAGVTDGAALSRYLRAEATLDQFREFVVHRSIYHLKEGDPHTWVIPRLTGRLKAALVEVQADEYGGGRLERMHSTLFSRTMRCLGLTTGYGAYVDHVPATTLATNNLMSLFGLHRRHRASALGHLAAFEMTSAQPNRRYADGLRRLGVADEAALFYDEHVEADSVHEQIVAHDLCGAYGRNNPGSDPAIMFGARCGLALEERFAANLLQHWQAGASSLRSALAPVGVRDQARSSS